MQNDDDIHCKVYRDWQETRVNISWEIISRKIPDESPGEDEISGSSPE